MGNKLKKSLAWLTMALMLTSQVNVVLATTYEDGSTKYIDNEASSLNVGDAIYEVEELADTDDEVAEFSAPTTLGVRNVGASTLNLNIGSSSKGGLNTNIGGSNKKEQEQPKTATSKVYEFKGVKDSELKADHRYGKPVNYKDPLYKNSDFLKLRLMMEKTFESPTNNSGVSGLLGRGYFNGSLGSVTDGNISYSRSIFNTGINKLTENNKEALAKIASETFADVKDKPYAYLIPVAIYYGLYDNITFETVQADNPQLGYKKGDLLFNGNKEITYAEAAVTLGNYDGVHKKFNGTLPKELAGKWFTNDLGNLTDGLCLYGVTQSTLDSAISKGAFAHNLVNNGGAVNDRSQVGEQMVSGNMTYASKDTKKMMDSPDDRGATVKFYKDALANPSKGTPYEYGIALGTLKKVGIKVDDANGNSNWHKGITRGEALQWMQQLSEIDTGGFPSHMIEK